MAQTSPQSSARPRVLLLLHELSQTGAPKVALDFFEALSSDYELQTVSLRGGPHEARCRRFSPLRILLNFLPPTRDSSLRAQAQYGIKRVLAEAQWRTWGRPLQAWKPEAIYVNSMAALPIFRHIALPSAPVILHVHELDSFLEPAVRGQRDLLVDLPQRYIAASEAVARALVDTCGVSPRKIAVVHECVPDSYLENVAPPRADESAPFIVGGAGHTDWRKGITLWLFMARALTDMLGENAVRFIWVGVTDNDIGWQFRNMAKKLGLEKLIEFVPVTTNPLPHFQRFDVFAMTSWEDPCPIVVLENMALGTPVTCFAGGGGGKEEVGDNGLVIENFAPRDMATAIAELARDPQRRAALGAAARRRVQENFTLSVQLPKIRHEIETVLNPQS